MRFASFLANRENQSTDQKDMPISFTSEKTSVVSQRRGLQIRRPEVWKKVFRFYKSRRKNLPSSCDDMSDMPKKATRLDGHTLVRDLFLLSRVSACCRDWQAIRETRGTFSPLAPTFASQTLTAARWAHCAYTFATSAANSGAMGGGSQSSSVDWSRNRQEMNDTTPGWDIATVAMSRPRVVSSIPRR